jgi:hypothetical protein
LPARRIPGERRRPVRRIPGKIAGDRQSSVGWGWRLARRIPVVIAGPQLMIDSGRAPGQRHARKKWAEQLGEDPVSPDLIPVQNYRSGVNMYFAPVFVFVEKTFCAL